MYFCKTSILPNFINLFCILHPETLFELFCLNFAYSNYHSIKKIKQNKTSRKKVTQSILDFRERSVSLAFGLLQPRYTTTFFKWPQGPRRTKEEEEDKATEL